MTELAVIQGDITKLEVDAIVNAASPALLGCHGVDGAIHRAAGPELLGACRRLGGCDHGDAKITPGFNLPARYVIHAVGPIWHGGGAREDYLLKLCYRRSMELAAGCELRSIAFPCIGTGMYRFPKTKAAEIAIETVSEFTRVHPFALDQVVFCMLDAEMVELYQKLLSVEMVS